MSQLPENKVYREARIRVVGLLHIVDGIDLIVRGEKGGKWALKAMFTELEFWYKKGK